MTADDIPTIDAELASALAKRDYADAAQLLHRGAQIDRVLRREVVFDRDIVQETSTYLIDAAASGDVETVTFLLEHGADPNIAATYTGRTALVGAVAFRHAAVVDLLLAHGANVDASDRHQSMSAIEYATTNVDPAVVRSLLAAGAPRTFRRLNFSIDGGAAAREVVRLLVEHGGDINQIDDWGRTPLMWAAQYAEVETVRDMIARGADVHRVSEPNMNGVNGKETAVGLAKWRKRSDVVAVLLQHGARDVPPTYRDGASLWERVGDWVQQMVRTFSG